MSLADRRRQIDRCLSFRWVTRLKMKVRIGERDAFRASAGDKFVYGYRLCPCIGRTSVGLPLTSFST
jgi:hypothetical protein